MRSQASIGRHLRFEVLEDRRVLSASLQIDAAAYDNAISPDDPGIAKIGYELASIADLASRFELEKLTDMSLLLATSRVSGIRDTVLIEAVASGEASSLSKDLATLGMTGMARAGRMVSGILPISAIDALSSLTTLAYARPSYSPMTNVGVAVSQGDESQRTDIIREYAGLDGTGITIGVLSDSFSTSATVATNEADDILSGDLPGANNPNGFVAAVNVVDDYTIAESQAMNGALPTDEGRAMLQIIHDAAPAADLAFATAFEGLADFAANIRLLAQDINAGDVAADVIVDDVIYLSEPFFQDGIVAQAVNDVVADGVTYVSAAGNFARQSYENNYNPHATATGIRGGALQDFGGGDFTQAITVPVGSVVSFSFQWDEPFFAAGGIGSASNYDLLLIGNNGTTVLPQNQSNLLGGQDQNNIGNDALEFMSFFNDGTFDFNNDLIADTNFNLAFEQVAGPAAGRVKYVYNNAAITIDQFATNSATTFGKANTNGAISVGAAAYFDTPEFNAAQPILEGFSALGGVDILFDTAGNRLATPEVREGVDIVAPDGVNTTFFGQDIAQDADTLPNFFGTSAAAPHVAGLAALLLQADPSLTPAGIESALEQSAIDMDNPFTVGFDTGFDNASGYGFVDALGAIGIVQNTPQLVGLDPDEYLVVNDNRDLLDANAAPNIIDVDLGLAGEQVSLRAAVINANGGGTETTLLVPENVYNLTLIGAGGDTQGDLDITGDVTIVGAGAGLTVIDAGGAAGINDRLFEINSNGSLDLSRVTLTGGNLSGANAVGAAVYVRDDSALTLTDSAVIGNTTIGAGGAIFRLLDGSLTIKRSVFTDNQAGTYGGAIRSNGTMGVLAIEGSIFANNTAGITGANVLLGNSTIMRNYGNNLIDDTTGDGGFFSTALNDQIATAGSVDQVVTNMADRIDVADGGLSLREAIIAANGGAGTQVVWAPAWKHRLELAGGGNNAGDLDITGDVTIVGAGAGMTVVDAGGENGLGDRVFDVTGTGSLDLSRATVTGGFLAAGSGAGFQVQGTADLTVTDSAIVDNNAEAGSGGGVFRFMDGNATFLRTVFTGNNAGMRGGAIRTNGQTGTITIGASVLANNTASTDGANVFLSGNKINFGNNFIDNTATDFGFFSTTQGDYIGSVDYVVTSIADTFDHSDNNVALSLREAIDLANTTAGTEEIWLPDWTFVLTRDRAAYGGGSPTDMDIAFGDLDISDSLTVRRAGAALSPGTSAVKWRQGVTDATFDLLGDFTGTGINDPDDGDVDGFDFSAWQQQNGSGSVDPLNWGLFSADADDDGDVDSDDLAVWNANFGNTLDLFNIMA